MDKHSTPTYPAGLSTKKLEQPSDKTVTFLLNFARLYMPVVEKIATSTVVLN
jgi:hypothetical protein